MDENRKLIMAALVIMLGSNTGSILNAYSPAIRADPYTGLEAAKMEAKLTGKISEQRSLLVAEIHKLNSKVQQLKSDQRECE